MTARIVMTRHVAAFEPPDEEDDEIPEGAPDELDIVPPRGAENWRLRSVHVSPDDTSVVLCVWEEVTGHSDGQKENE